ncbi:MAG TPA: MFS transporter [Croceibacterium sp.]|nr:MFS transporter [Croceibacterium sp.]
MTTAHIEAGPAVDQAHDSQGVVRFPIVFMPLFAPFGISSGYVSVTLGFLLSRAGVPTAIIGALIALSVWPQTWKILWAPVVDTVGNPKLWYGVGTTLVGGTILLMSVLPMTRAEVPLFSTLIIVSSIASTLVSMSTEIFMANQTPPELRGRASGWSQAGNLGGAGIGGGLGLLLAEHVGHAWVSGAVLALMCFVCWAGVLFLPRLDRTAKAPSYLRELLNVALDVWSVAKSRLGYLALVIMVLPIASGAVPWSAVAKEWHAGGDLVALVNGVAGGLASMVGAMLAGWVCDRMDVKRAYCLFGILVGLAAVAMIALPRTPTVFTAFVLLYSAMVGMGYAGYAAIVLEAIGKKSPATNWNLMAALSNIPIAVMSTFDGWVHDKYGTNAMLLGELVLPAIAILGFGVLVLVTRPRAQAA